MNPGPILIGLPGAGLDAISRAQLTHPAVGGVVLFTRNFESRNQLLELVDEIRGLRSPRLLITIDQEGGRVQRLRDGFTELPPLGVLGRLYRHEPEHAVDMAYRHGRVMATEMLAFGIDLSFAPVLDLDRGSRVIGDRAFSGNPATVIALGRSYLAGMRDSGMRSTGKHFPGHGSVEADSHTDDVRDARPLTDIRESDLQPFAALAGDLGALMIAHVVYPAVDELPAGYSEPWLKDILREDMAYRGVILSDDLGMHAAKSVGDLSRRTLRCLDAGCDLALVCLPDDVASLLRETETTWPDAAAAIERLYGRPTVDRVELEAVVREGIREWGHWQASLERLGGQAWS
jgi:beta-N-acetylhexosaminidase